MFEASKHVPKTEKRCCVFKLIIIIIIIIIITITITITIMIIIIIIFFVIVNQGTQLAKVVFNRTLKIN